jgi:hypothetical protein
VEASKKLLPIFVDCDWGKKNKDVSTKYGVRGYPTVIFTDSEGNEVAKLGGRDAASVAGQIEEIAKKYGRTFIETFEKAVEVAKEGSKPVLMFFATPKGDSIALEQALCDASLKELLEKFAVAKVDIKKDNADCKKFGTGSYTQPAIFVVDPAAEKPEAKPLKKLTGKRGPKELKKELEDALKKYEAAQKETPKDEPKKEEGGMGGDDK